MVTVAAPRQALEQRQSAARAGDVSNGAGGGAIVHERLYDKEKIERKSQQHDKLKAIATMKPSHLPPPIS